MHYKPNIPKDFDQFWSNAFDQVQNAPIQYSRKPSEDHQTESHFIEELTFQGTDQQTLCGWIAIPKISHASKSLPAFVWLPPYGRSSVLPDKYGTREGYVSLSFNFHGNAAFHQEKYEPQRGYFADGILKPNTWIYKRLLQNACLAVNILAELDEVNAKKIGAMGLSQGGGMSIWLGALHPLIRAVCADLPFFGGVSELLSNKVYRYPPKEIIDFIDNDPEKSRQVHETITYYDTTHFATRCKTPTLISYGTKDPASRPPAVKSIYEALAGEKHLIEYEWGHDWHPQMIENNLAWLDSKLD